MTTVTKGHTLKVSGSTASGIVVQGGDVQVISGGEVDGTTIEWSVDVLAAKKIVIILTFAAPGIAEKNAQDAAKFITSIRKIQ